MSLALQGSRMGLVVHGLGGLDYDKARTELNVPEHVNVECMVALGYPGNVEDLPPHLAAREAPNGRNQVASFAFEGGFPR
jgi:nitroreductase